MIKKVEVFKRDLTNTLSKEFMSLIRKELGVLDVAISFAYLFRRFGVPKSTDEGQLSFTYLLKYKHIYVQISGSHKEHVNFQLFFNIKHSEEFNKKRDDFLYSLFVKAQKKDVVFAPHIILVTPLPPGLTKKQIKKQAKLYDKQAKCYFGKKDYKYIDKQLKQKNVNDDVYTMLNGYREFLNFHFKEVLTADEVKQLAKSISLDDVPVVKRDAIKFIKKIKKLLCKGCKNE